MKKVPMQPKGSAELYKKCVELHRAIYKKAIWNEEKYKLKTGYMLRSLFGPGVWTLKDLLDPGLQKVIDICNGKTSKQSTLIRHNKTL